LAGPVFGSRLFFHSGGRPVALLNTLLRLVYLGRPFGDIAFGSFPQSRPHRARVSEVLVRHYGMELTRNNCGLTALSHAAGLALIGAMVR